MGSFSVAAVRPQVRFVASWFWCAGGLAFLACDAKPTKAVLPGASSASSGEAADVAAPVTSAAPAASASAAVAVTYDENDFTASERNRDPFRSYIDKTIDRGGDHKPVFAQRSVAADRFSLDELKLVAIVRGNTTARAMLVDPQGKGWVITRGEFIGKSENVRQGGPGGAEYELNWKVDRIRDNDVIFVREEPGSSTAMGPTRVISLRSDADEAAAVKR